MTLPRFSVGAQKGDLGKNIHPDRKAVLDSLTVDELVYVRDRYEKFLRHITPYDRGSPQTDLTGDTQSSKTLVSILLGLVAERFGEGAAKAIIGRLEKEKVATSERKDGDAIYG